MDHTLSDVRGHLGADLGARDVVVGGQSSRPDLDPVELVALGVVMVASVGFGVYGFVTGAPSTVGYILIVAVVAVMIVLLREKVSRTLTIGLAVLAVAHLAGGLVRVGDDVLYNASVGWQVFQYDHLVHASGVFLGVLVLQRFIPTAVVPSGRLPLIAVCVLAGLGLGAVNETIEFLTTLAHSGAHVGGYDNTGWDLVSNLVGALAAGIWVSRSQGAPSALTTGA